jgi:hypothetical protein
MNPLIDAAALMTSPSLPVVQIRRPADIREVSSHPVLVSTEDYKRCGPASVGKARGLSMREVAYSTAIQRRL